MKKLYPLIKFFDVDNLTYVYDAKSRLITEVDAKNLILNNDRSVIKQYVLEKYTELGIFQKGTFKKVTPENDRFHIFTN
jgi:YD repeat-containing protein